MAGPRVLVIDDEPLMRLSLRRLLRREGFEVLLAGGGEEGFTLVQRNRPSVIVLDMRMPGMDGAQFLAALRQEPALAAIPVVAISANAELLPQGVAAAFAKPFEPIQFLAEVRRCSPKPFR